MKRAFWLVPTKVLIFKFCLRALKKVSIWRAVLVNTSNSSSSKLEMVSQTNDHSVMVTVVYFDSSYRIRTVFFSIVISKENNLIVEDGAIVKKDSFFNYLVLGIVFLSGDKINPSVGPVGKKRIVGIALIDS
jgi:hypothetical protein